jgi:hypothetical protein
LSREEGFERLTNSGEQAVIDAVRGMLGKYAESDGGCR